MANWYGSCRSNYFHVKDVDAFKNWLSQYDAQFIEKDGMVGFYSTDPDSGGLPTRYVDDDDLTDCDSDTISVLDEIQDHLAENEVCIILEVGAEKLRWLSGMGWAIGHTGEIVQINLQTVLLAEAKDAFPNCNPITEASY